MTSLLRWPGIKNYTKICVPCKWASRQGSNCPRCGSELASFPSMKCELPKKTSSWWDRKDVLAWFTQHKGRGTEIMDWSTFHRRFPWPKDKRAESRAQAVLAKHDWRGRREREAAIRAKFAELRERREQAIRDQAAGV